VSALSACPHCQKTIEITDKHMGALYTCPHCHGVFFVGWDGTPEIVTHEPESPAAAEPTPSFAAEPAPDFSAPEDSGPSMEGSPLELAPVEQSESPMNFGESSQDAGVVQDAYVTTEPETEHTSPAEGSVNFDTPMESVFDEGVGNSSGDFQDVANYANSEDVSGPMTYSLQIRGIELAETFEHLREAVTDSRFGWDANEIMAKIKGGQLILRDLNPTKASILVNRIKYLSLEISWKQEVFGEGS
jgi:hypothetical protein